MKTILGFALVLFGFMANAQNDVTMSSGKISGELAEVIRKDIDRQTEKLESATDKSVIYKDRAMKYFALNEYDNAVADFSKLIESSEKYLAYGYYYRGLSKKMSGNFYAISACDDLKKAKELGYESKGTNWEGISLMCGF